MRLELRTHRNQSRHGCLSGEPVDDAHREWWQKMQSKTGICRWAVHWKQIVSCAMAAAVLTCVPMARLWAGSPPGTIVDVGTLVDGVTRPANEPLAPMEVIFYRFELAQPIASTDYFQVDTIGSGFDTEIGLYDTNGQWKADNDDIAVGILTNRHSALFFGNAPNSKGTLGAGEYFLAVGAHPVGFGLTDFIVNSSSTTTGTIQLNFHLGDPLPGDLDCDGDLDFDDINAFVLGLKTPDVYETMFGVPTALKGDLDDDGDLDFDDIEPFAEALRENLTAAVSALAVPEPSTGTLICSLAMWGAVAGFRWEVCRAR